jgi:hypothetical protein
MNRKDRLTIVFGLLALLAVLAVTAPTLAMNDPVTGRWTTRDPLYSDPGGPTQDLNSANLYAALFGNPLSRMDHDGREPTKNPGDGPPTTGPSTQPGPSGSGLCWSLDVTVGDCTAKVQTTKGTCPPNPQIEASVCKQVPQSQHSDVGCGNRYCCVDKLDLHSAAAPYTTTITISFCWTLWAVPPREVPCEDPNKPLCTAKVTVTVVLGLDGWVGRCQKCDPM